MSEPRCGGSGELVESVTPHLDHRDPAHETRESVCPGCPDCQAVAITDDMVERAAFALWAHDFEDHMGFPARREAWPDQIENPANYRTWAGIALAAASHREEKRDA